MGMEARKRRLLNTEVHEEIGEDDAMSDISCEYEAAATETPLKDDVRIRTRTAEWSPAKGWVKEEDEPKFPPAPPSPAPLKSLRTTFKPYLQVPKIEPTTPPTPLPDQLSPAVANHIDSEFQELIKSTHELLTPRGPPRPKEADKANKPIGVLPSTGNKHIDKMHEIIHDVDLSPSDNNRSPSDIIDNMTSPLTGSLKGKGTKEHLEKLKKLREEQLKEKALKDAERYKKKKELEERKKNERNLPATPSQHHARVQNKLQDMNSAQDSKHKAMDDMLAKIDMHLKTPKSKDPTPSGNTLSDVKPRIQVNSSMPILPCLHLESPP